ncbi:unnamed protein product, partial [Heterotrigona itama]
IAIITETWLIPKEILKILDYTLHRKDGFPINTNKSKGAVLIAIRNSIPAEDIPQLAFPNIDFLSIKVKTTIYLIIGAVYARPKTKILTTDLDSIISLHGVLYHR